MASGLRVGAADEARGLDLAQHAEAAYAMTREFNIGDSVPRSPDDAKGE